MIKLACQAPFNFDLSFKIFSNGDPQIQIYESGIYRQLLSLDDETVLVEVSSTGTVNEPELEVNLIPDHDLDEAQIMMAGKILGSIFDLDLNLQDFYDDIRDEPVLSNLINRLRGLKNPATPTFFEAIVTSIIEQQISLKAANSIKNRFIKEFGNILKLDGDIYYGFPGPEIICKLNDDDLRSCGLSFRKASYIIGISMDIIDGNIDLEGLKTLPTKKIIEKLLTIRGIGSWTAELAVIRGLHRFNALPVDDVGIKRVVSNYYPLDKPVSSDDLREIAKKWGKWKGLAVYYLIVADLMDLKITK